MGEGGEGREGREGAKGAAFGGEAKGGTTAPDQPSLATFLKQGGSDADIDRILRQVHA